MVDKFFHSISKFKRLYNRRTYIKYFCSSNFKEFHSRPILYTKKIETIESLTNKLMDDMKVPRGYQPERGSREHLLQYIPKSQSDLPPRSMKDSFISATVPLSSDLALQDRYVSSCFGGVRVGRLMEDMDIFAAHEHIFDPKRPKDVALPYVLVTACVDLISISEYKTKVKSHL